MQWLRLLGRGLGNARRTCCSNAIHSAVCARTELRFLLRIARLRIQVLCNPHCSFCVCRASGAGDALSTLLLITFHMIECNSHCILCVYRIAGPGECTARPYLYGHVAHTAIVAFTFVVCGNALHTSQTQRLHRGVHHLE